MTIILELLIHNLAAYLESHSQFAYMVYRRLQNEIMILGFVSFIIFSSHVTGIATNVGDFIYKHFDDDPDMQFTIFELTHMGIFLAMLLFIAMGIYLVYIADRIAERWGDLERMKTYKVAKEWEDIQEQVKDMNVFAFLTSGLVFEYYAKYEQFWYHKMRRSFVEQHSENNNFNFSAYLVHSLRFEAIMQMLEIHWSTWVFIIVVAIANYIRSTIPELHFGGASSGKQFYELTPLGVALVLVIGICYAKALSIRNNILQIEFADVLHETFDPSPGSCVESCCCCDCCSCCVGEKREREVDACTADDFPEIHGDDPFRDVGPSHETAGPSASSSNHHGSGSKHHEGGGHGGHGGHGGGEGHHARATIYGGGCFASYKPTLHAKYFWLNRPYVLMRVVQTCMLLQTWYFILVLVFIKYEPWYMTIINLLLVAFNVIVLAPRFLATYVVVGSVGVFSKEEVLKAAWRRAFQLVKSKYLASKDMAVLLNEMREKMNADESYEASMLERQSSRVGKTNKTANNQNNGSAGGGAGGAGVGGGEGGEIEVAFRRKQYGGIGGGSSREFVFDDEDDGQTLRNSGSTASVKRTTVDPISPPFEETTDKDSSRRRRMNNAKEPVVI